MYFCIVAKSTLEKLTFNNASYKNSPFVLSLKSIHFNLYTSVARVTLAFVRKKKTEIAKTEIKENRIIKSSIEVPFE